jgi:hypothetical protein
MANIIDELWIKLGIDGKAAAAGASKVKASMQGLAKTAQGLAKTFAGVGMALTGAFTLASYFSDWKSQAVQIQNTANAVGKSMEEVQAYAAALGKYGGNVDSFTSSFRSLNSELVKISTTGSSRAGKILEAYGINVGSIGQLRDTDEVLADIAELMHGMSMAEAQGLGAKIGLDSSMVQLLHEGRDGYKSLIEQKKKDALYTEEDAKTVREYNAAQKKLSVGLARIANTLFRTVVPVFAYLVGMVGDFIKSLSKHQVALKIFFTMIAALLVGMLLPSIIAFFTALASNPLTWVVLAIAAVALVLEDLYVWATKGESALPGLWSAIFGSPDEAMQTWEDLKATVKAVWDVIYSAIKGMTGDADVLGTVLKALAAVIAGAVVGSIIALTLAMLGNPVTWFIAAFVALIAIFQNWDAVVAWVTQNINATLDALFQWINSQFDALEAWAGSVVDSIEGFFIGLGDTIMSAIGNAIDWALGKLAELASAIANTPIIGTAVSWGMSAYDAITGGGGNTTNNSSDTRIGTINVVTQATDSSGIASSIGSATRSRFNYQQANGGAY